MRLIPRVYNPAMPHWLNPGSPIARIALQVALLFLAGGLTYWLTSWLGSDLAGARLP